MFPEFLDNSHMKVSRFSALRTGRLYPPPRNIFGTLFCQMLGRTQGHGAAGPVTPLGIEMPPRATSSRSVIPLHPELRR